mmetsp:Transcript_19547/g.77767  ORF Transcript_19547/g.77767 Transcript_19547/m.77767 type:complete len:236 (+) Transcript_19547:720-1427(+)
MLILRRDRPERDADRGEHGRIVAALGGPRGRLGLGIADVRVVRVGVLVEVAVQAVRGLALRRRPLGPGVVPIGICRGDGRDELVRAPREREDDVRDLADRRRATVGVRCRAAPQERLVLRAEGDEKGCEVRREHGDLVVHEGVEAAHVGVKVVEVGFPHRDGLGVAREDRALDPVQLRPGWQQRRVDLDAAAAQIQVGVRVRERRVDEPSESAGVANARRHGDLVEVPRRRLCID